MKALKARETARPRPGQQAAQVLVCNDCNEAVVCNDCGTALSAAPYPKLPDGSPDLPFPLTCPDCGGAACCPTCRFGTVDEQGRMILACDECEVTAPLNEAGLCEACAAKVQA